MKADMTPKYILSFNLPNTVFKIKCRAHDFAQLSAKFQIWCASYDISNIEAVAMLIAGTEIIKQYTYCTPEEWQNIADTGVQKLKKLFSYNTEIKL